MTKPSPELINALRKTARNLKNGASYQWGHMGSCNCGNLAQELTSISRREIHEYALRNRMGDWSEQTEAYCANSNAPMDLVISKMLEKGLTVNDLQHLEKLSDQQVLRRLPLEQRYLKHNRREDVILYLQTWAEMLEEQISEKIELPDFELLIHA